MTREQRERDSLQKTEVKVQVDDCIKFAQLGGTEENQVDELEKSLALATGRTEGSVCVGGGGGWMPGAGHRCVYSSVCGGDRGRCGVVC
jgi:hypothetical protein